MDTITLYKRDSKDKIRVWSIFAQLLGTPSGNLTEVVPAEMVTNGGILGGALVETRIPFDKGMNIGRSNQTTPYQQACQEAASKAELKRKEGYVDRVDQLQESQTMGSGFKEPMLAQKFHPTGAQSSSKTLDQLKLRGQLIGVQRKKDGNRAYIVLDPGKNPVFLNRKTLPYGFDFPALSDELVASYRIAGLSERIILDGEFYTTEVSFNKLNGILKAKTLKPGYEQILNSCKFHLFDQVSDAGYVTRHAGLQAFESSLVHIEEYYQILATEANLLAYLRQFQAEGEEGLMIRTLDAPYQHKRTWDLMKYKDDQTEDYVIEKMEEHALGGMVGAIVMRAPEGLTDRDGTPILTFKAGTTGLSHEESRQMWDDYKEDLRGELRSANYTTKYLWNVGTVRFFEFSEYGIPRFPKFLGVRAD